MGLDIVNWKAIVAGEKGERMRVASRGGRKGRIPFV